MIKYYFLLKKTLVELKAKLNKYFSGSAPSIRINYKWCADFCWNQKSIDSAKRSGRPKEATTKEMI